MSAASRYIGPALATVSGCLWFLACPPFDVPGLGWIAAVPMLLAIDRARTLRGALLLGGWAGMIETAGGFYWLIDLTQRFAGFAWVAGAGVLLLFCASRALIFVIAAVIIFTIRRGTAAPMALLAPLGLVVGELLVPQVFPCGQWISQAWHPLIIQIAELTGPLGITALLMVVNGAVYGLLAREPHGMRSAAVATALLAAALVFGTTRMREVDARISAAPRLNIGLVQPNFAYAADGDMSRDEKVRELTALQEQSQRLAQSGAELIVWSEGAYPDDLPRDFAQDWSLQSPARIRRGFTTPLIFGSNTVEPGLDDPYNSALLLNHDGDVIGRYDKVRLLAFGEYIPGIETFPWLRRLLPEGTGRFKAGNGPGVMLLPQPISQPWRLAPLICYEDLLPGFIRSVGALHPDVLVNLTSDSWFGARSEPWEHLALAVFGAIELRVAMVRSVNSGVSAMIDPNGRLAAATYADDPYREPRTADRLLVSVPRMAGGHTPFVVWGNWFAYGCLLLTLGMLTRVIWNRNQAQR